jgi:diguanylate cyclase (GGDEF)-like protein
MSSPVSPGALPEKGPHPLEQLLRDAGEGVIRMDADMVTTYCNDVYASWLGLAREDIVGKTPDQYVPDFARSKHRDAVMGVYRTRVPADVVGYSTLFKSWTHLRIFPTPDGGGCMFVTQASPTLVEQHQLSQQALVDSTTSLPNKRALLQAIRERAAAGESFAMCVIGLRRFKTVNDLEGFQEGDKVLMQVASRMHSASLEGERLFRLHSDLFVALLPGEGPQDERVRALIGATLEPIALAGKSFMMGASAGLVAVPRHGTAAEALIHRATLALGTAKRSGQAFVEYRDSLEAVTPMLDDLREGSLELDGNLRVMDCNDIYLEHFGLAREAVVGHFQLDYLPNFDRSIFHAGALRCLRTRQPTTVIGYLTMAGRWAVLRCHPRDHGGVLLLGQFISELAFNAYQRSLQPTSNAMTGLPNEVALADDLRAYLDAGKAFTLVVLGLSRLPVLTESLGVSRSDRLSMQAAASIRAELPVEDLFYQLNNAQFAAVFLCDEEEADRRVGALLEIANQPLPVGEQRFVPGAVGGMVRAPGDGADVESLLRRAIMALRDAERRGTSRNRVVRHDSELESRLQQRTDLESALRQALAAGEELRLFLQPKRSLQDGRISGAEALIRWLRPGHDMVAPNEFLPVAQECGLMVAIDRWVIREAIAHLTTLRAQGLEMSVAINLSVESLEDEDLVVTLRDALQAASLPAGLLEVEIPEGALMRNAEGSRRVLQQLTELGVRVSVDDFGTGYSSFAYLARFPVSALKIDRAFVADMFESATGRAIVHGIIGLAHALSLKVIAEGVETAEQSSALGDMKCDETQGYGFARPMPIEQLVSFARNPPPA